MRQAGGDGWPGSAAQLHSQKTLRQTDRKTTAQCFPLMDTNLLVILKSNIYMMKRKKPEAGPLKMKSKTKHIPHFLIGFLCVFLLCSFMLLQLGIYIRVPMSSIQAWLDYRIVCRARILMMSPISYHLIHIWKRTSA